MAPRRSNAQSFRSEVKEELRRLQVKGAAQRQLRAKREKPPELPPQGWTLEDALEEAPDEVPFTIEKLHPEGGNTRLAARYKAGKSTVLGNLTKSLVDGDPFFGAFDVRSASGVAYFNYELSKAQFIRWLADLEIEHADLVIPLQLRGRRFPFWIREHRKTLAAWLQSNEIDTIVIDPAAKAWKGLVDNENDNAQVGRFLDAIDELKIEAEVSDAFLAHHLGRKEHAQDAEHGRGASVLDDWADSLWFVTKESDGTRIFRAEGRDVDLPAGALSFDPTTRRLEWTSQSRSARREVGAMRTALTALSALRRKGHYPANSTQWRDAIDGLANDARNAVIKRAKDEGYVQVKEGEKNARLHSLTAKGSAFLDKERDQ